MGFVNYSTIEYAKLDESQYLQTGIKKFDKTMIGLGLGQLIVLTGTRAGGKTTLIGNLICEFTEHGYDGLLCSFEMSNPRLKRWLNNQALGKDKLHSETTRTGKDVYVPNNQTDREQVEQWLGGHLQVYDNSSFEINAVSRDIKGMLELNPNIKYVILDNLMKLDTGKLGDNKYEAQSMLVKRLQVYAQKNNICLILVVHPNKIKTLPRIEDVGGSGDILNTADTVLFVHRVNDDFKVHAKEYFEWKDDCDAFKYPTLLEIAKDREFGNDGAMIGLYFEPNAKRFLNYENENKKYSWMPHQYTMDELKEEIEEDEGALPF